RKLRTYALTAPRVPRRICASVHATTSTIKSARQAMVSLREVSASQRRELILVKVEALQEVDEVGPRGGDRPCISNHLHEPGISLEERQASHHAALLLAFAGEVVDRERTGLRLDSLPHGGERRLVDGAEA